MDMLQVVEDPSSRDVAGVASEYSLFFLISLFGFFLLFFYFLFLVCSPRVGAVLALGFPVKIIIHVYSCLA